jgi:hypothetical protein
MKHSPVFSSIRLTAVLLGAACFSNSSAKATLIAEEEFNYGAGALAGQNGGTGWSGAWTVSGAGGAVTTPGFSFTDSSLNVLQTAGLKANFADGNNGNFRLPILSPDDVGTTLYISFLGQITTPGTGYAGVSLFQGGAENLFLGKPNASANWGFDTKGTNTKFTGTVPVTTLSLMVFRIDFGATTTVSMYINPTLGTEPTVADVTATRGAFTWDTIRIQSGGGTSGGVDEIRIGDTYASVTPTVPEPGGIAALLGGTALLGVVRRRRAGEMGR